MRWIALALPLLALNACIYYENNGECESCQWDDWEDLDDDGDTNDPGDDILALGLFMTPDEAELGDIVISSLKATEQVDLSTVTVVEFYGAVNVHAFEARTDEVILSLGIDPDAELGPVGIVIEFEDGAIAEEDAVLTLIEPTEPPAEEDPCADP